MCGIAGSLNWGPSESVGLVKCMLDALKHRGPDAEGIVNLNPLILGHRRLSIIDTSSLANQPLCDITERYWISLNGEIYNYQILKKELTQLGHSFKTQSDTEVLLEAYKAWGLNFLPKLVGMYAFALWDSIEQTLLLVRDRLGEKPLFYYAHETNSNHNVIFASDLKALKQHPKIPLDMSSKALTQFLSLNYISTDACILENVKKLPPAHYLLLKPKAKPIINSYWDLSHHFTHKKDWGSEASALEHFHHLLNNTLSQQTISDVPLGAFLSGGIDSSTIVAGMTRLNKSEFNNTYSIGFKEKSFNELEESHCVAKHLNTNHFTTIVHSPRAEELTSILSHFDEPFADTSLIPMYYLAQFARQHVTVCLSGDGGDELFAGYETYIANKMHHLFNFLPKSFISLLNFGVQHFIPSSFTKVSMDYKLKKFMRGAHYSPSVAHYFWRTIFEEEQKQKLLKDDVLKDVNQSRYSPYSTFETFFNEVPNCHFLDKSQYVDIKTWLVDDILVKTDRTSMAHSLETRAPFLDHRIVEFAASLPVTWKLKGLKTKYLLKKSQEPYLPPSIIHRSKKGFNAPVSEWFTKDLINLGREISLDTNMQDLFQTAYIETLWKEHVSKKQDHGLKLFGLTCFGLWYNQHKAFQRDRSFK